MARYVYPDEGSRLVYRTTGSGAALASAAGATAVVYSDLAGTVLADIQTTGGLAISGSVLTVDGSSLLPLFLGPDGVDTLYVRVSGGAATPIYARTDDRIDALSAALTATNLTSTTSRNDSTDDTTAIQAALNGTQPVVFAPHGQYKTISTVDFKSNSRWQGVMAGKPDPGGTLLGSVLRWHGSASTDIARVLNAEFVEIDGLGIDGRAVSGCVGLHIDSTNSPATRQVTVRNLAIESVGTNGTNGIGVLFGTPGNTATDPQMDGFSLGDGGRVEIQNTFTGIEVDSYNALSLSVIENVVCRNPNRGIWLRRCGPVHIRNSTFGGETGTTPAWIDIESQDSVTIENCQGENDVGTVLFLRVTGNSLQPITLKNCTVNRPSEIHGTRQVVVEQGYYTDNITIFGGASITLRDVQFAAGKGVVRDGTSTGTIKTESTVSGVPVTVVDNKTDGVVVQYTSTGTNPSLQFTNSTATRTYQVRFNSSGGFQIVDITSGNVVLDIASGSRNQAVQTDSAGAILNGIPRLALLALAGGTATATGPVGTIVKKVTLYDSAGNPVGVIPVYNTIT